MELHKQLPVHNRLRRSLEQLKEVDNESIDGTKANVEQQILTLNDSQREHDTVTSAPSAGMRKAKVTIIDLENQSLADLDRYLAIEEPLELYLNGRLSTTIFSTPIMLKEQVIGYLLDEGIISSVDQVLSIRFQGNNRANVHLSFDPSSKLSAASMYRVVTTACGLWDPEFTRLLDRIRKPRVDSSYSVRVSEIFHMMEDFMERCELWKITGSTHSAALYERGRLVGFGEDVGRHNAMDKAIGQAALSRAKFEMCVAFSTGRQPADMVLKTARIGVPIVVSNTNAVYSGVYAAERTNSTLIGSVRPPRLVLYTGKHRVCT
ncbi:MAG: formate dehydrogenase accessory sulfurtransferase FdhD [Nitrososphaerota archaeon]|nr:formate dehydrogenase accessory sulfurtransferase FdhD [Nitrososphaerota archaeon]